VGGDVGTITVGSLFSGIGGLDLGLERAGMRVVWQSEIDPYACRVLAKHWPDVPNLGDITTIDWTDVEPVDLICGGYPCQPFSLAGTRAGTADRRHLWPHFADALRHLRPRWALLENVPGHLSLGFGRVLGDLAELGYDTEWQCIPAAAVGAPHLRWRVFVVAHAHREGEPGEPVDAFTRPGVVVPDTEPHRHVADTGCVRLLQCAGIERESSGHQARSIHHWAVEPDVGRVAHGIPARVDRLRTLGNAVVPQVAEYVGRRIVGAAA
jgi:DNA (cytosine-5)-methyltransferase 1